MLYPRRHAVALLAALAIAVPAPALAGEPTLLAQMDDVTATMAQAEPPLSEDPFSGEEEGDEGRDDRRDERREEGPAAGGREPLPETGIESGLIAMLGLALILSGSGLRLTLGRDAG